MKRYAVQMEYYDYNGSYEMNLKEFDSLIAAKVFFSVNKKKEYIRINLIDTVEQETIEKFAKI